MTDFRDHDHDEQERDEYSDREYGTLEKDFASVVSQVQKMVNSYHDMRQELARMDGKIPENLDTRIVTIELQLKQIIDDLEKQYVTQKEFERYKLEHAQMRYLIYGFIVMIMTSVVGAWLALIVHNASMVVK